jgi:hypothetical protein
MRLPKSLVGSLVHFGYASQDPIACGSAQGRSIRAIRRRSIPFRD